MANPWSVLADRDLVLHDVAMPEKGRYYDGHGVIFLRKGLSLAEQRATLWHELIHAERGDEHCTDKTEAHVDREAARRAIDVHDLADAMLWSDHHDEQADQLKITAHLLRVRLDSLHPSERGYLTRRLSMKERTA